MTETELKKFRAILDSRLMELSVMNRESLAIETSSDEMDRVQYFRERDLAMNDMERNSNRLREVRRALARMNGGTFGECVTCEEPINPKRLAAVPWASYCIGCQEAAEREAARDGGDGEAFVAGADQDA